MTAECCESLAGTDVRGETSLFQIVEAAERTPRAPNEMLQRVTDRRVFGLLSLKAKTISWIISPSDWISC